MENVPQYETLQDINENSAHYGTERGRYCKYIHITIRT